MNVRYHSTRGGQALVYLTRWQNCTTDSTAAPVIEEGRAVAIKHCRLPGGGGQFVKIQTLQEFQDAGAPSAARATAHASGPARPVPDAAPGRLALPSTADPPPSPQAPPPLQTALGARRSRLR